MALDYLVQLEADQTANCGRGGGDGGNDLAGDQFTLVVVRGFDAVVGCTQVGRSYDEVHVEVGVIVLLEVKWVKFDIAAGGRSRQGPLQATQLIRVGRRIAGSSGFTLRDINLYTSPSHTKKNPR